MSIPDRMYVGRVVGGLLLALGEPVELADAQRVVARYGFPPLHESDLAVYSPEQLAPLIPFELRSRLLSLLSELAGKEPIRQRLVQAYAALWQARAVTAPTTENGSRIVRWLIGELPRHHDLMNATEDPMDGDPYRSAGARPAQLTPVERTPLRQRIERIFAQHENLVAAVEQVIVGKTDVVRRVLRAMAARGHVLLVDVPGTGKTQLVKTIAAAIQGTLGRVQFTPDLLPLDITGSNVFDPKERVFHFRPGPLFANLVLADEINRATPKTQSALLEAMEEGAITVDGATHHLERPFLVLATMNPLDHQGTYALPAAQIDRFMVMLRLGYPAPDDEVAVLDRHLGGSPLAAVTPVMTRDDLLVWQETAPVVHVTPQLKRTVVDYVNALRGDVADAQSISPRATLAWVRLAQARAMLDGREFVTLEDVHETADDVLRHRLMTGRVSVRDRLRRIGIEAAG
jgi:MoxR-like ATPase